MALVILAPPGRVTAQEDKFQLTLNVLSGYYYRDITSGEATTIYMEITNTGNQAITGIRLTSDNPKGWDISLKPDSIVYLGAGSSQTIDMSVTAPSGTERGEYTLTIIAEASQTRAATSTVLRVQNTYSIWLWIGAGLAVLVICAFVIVFLRFGRDQHH